MGKSVIVNKEKKIKALFDKYGYEITPEKFEEVFIEEYPEDWKGVWERYKKHEVKDKKGKGHPMSHPKQYVRNIYNVSIKKHKQELYLEQNK